MLRYVVRRLLLLVPILLGVSVLIFFWVHALPGNPASALLGERATPELVKQYKERYGLDRPLPLQYVDYLKVTVVDRDLGTSITSRRTVTSEIGRRFPATIELAAAAMFFAIAIGLPLGFFAAKRCDLEIHYSAPSAAGASFFAPLSAATPSMDCPLRRLA